MHGVETVSSLVRDQRPDWCGRCSEADGSSARRHLSDDQDTVRG
eukprot:SAG25_NODE_6022_length_595_cov_6.151210_1_plen_43_part_01